METTHKARCDPETLSLRPPPPSLYLSLSLSLSLSLWRQSKRRRTRHWNGLQEEQRRRQFRQRASRGTTHPKRSAEPKGEVRQDATIMRAVAACRTSKATRHVPHATIPPQSSCHDSPTSWQAVLQGCSLNRHIEMTPSCP
jgi:hypothetical protein